MCVGVCVWEREREHIFFIFSDGSSMPMKIFEVARKSYGTDEDILFIFKNHTV